MAGTKRGGLKAAQTNKQRYGSNFYMSIGRLGGKISRGGGFAKNPELAREAGRKGGQASRKRRAEQAEAA
jgi:general stress protein YciG